MSEPLQHQLNYAGPAIAVVRGETFRFPPRSQGVQQAMTAIRIMQLVALGLSICAVSLLGLVPGGLTLAILFVLLLSIMSAVLLKFRAQLKSAVTIGVSDQDFCVLHDAGDTEIIQWSDVNRFRVKRRLFGMAGFGDLQVMTHSIGTHVSLVGMYDLDVLQEANTFLTKHRQKRTLESERAV